MLRLMRLYYLHHVGIYIKRNVHRHKPLLYLPNICAVDSSYFNSDGTTIFVKDFHGLLPKSFDPLLMDERERFKLGFIPSFDIYD